MGAKLDINTKHKKSVRNNLQNNGYHGLPAGNHRQGYILSAFRDIILNFTQGH